MLYAGLASLHINYRRTVEAEQAHWTVWLPNHTATCRKKTDSSIVAFKSITTEYRIGPLLQQVGAFLTGSLLTLGPCTGEGTRTPNLLLRRQALYPIELRLYKVQALWVSPPSKMMLLSGPELAYRVGIEPTSV